jgi:hypothetical protein
MIIFLSKPGLGKDAGLYSIIKNMIGERYCVITQKLERDIVSQFNSVLDNKLFITLDELSGKNSGKYEDVLKELITCEKDSIVFKRNDAISKLSTTHFMGFTNSSFPWKIEDSDRRFLAIDAYEQTIPDASYFTRLRKLNSDKAILRRIYDDLLSIDLSKWDAKSDRPNTAFMEELKEASRPLEEQFIIEYIVSQSVDVPFISSSELFTLFIDFIHKNTSSEDMYKTSKINFGRRCAKFKIEGFSTARKTYERGFCLEKNIAMKFLLENKLISE